MPIRKSKATFKIKNELDYINNARSLLLFVKGEKYKNQ